MRRAYFYHSFPRHKDRHLGLKILRSILERGLLLTAESRPIAGCVGLRAKKFIQTRVCFTALTPDRVAGHSEKFGAFSFEFDVGTLREFGALPAFYLPGQLPGGEIFNDAGDEVARHLLAAHDVLRRLWKMHDDGTVAEKKLARAVLRRVKPEKKLIQELFFTLQTLLNLYYPTDDSKWTGPLGYYEQREWKITPNLSYDGTWHYQSLGPKDRAALIALNPIFFGKKIRGKSRAALCYHFADVAGRNVVASARRIIVPDHFVSQARAIVRDTGHQIPVVATSRIK